MVQNDCVVLIWKISNLFKVNGIIESPEFDVNTFRKSGWKLCLIIPRSRSQLTTIELRNEYYEPGLCQLDLHIAISILSVRPEKTKTILDYGIVFPLIGVHEVKGFPSFNTLMAQKEDYLPNNVLTIQCRMRIVDSKDLATMFYQAYTRFGVGKITFGWLLNYSRLRAGVIQSQRFFLGQSQPIFSVQTNILGSSNKLGFYIEQQNRQFVDLCLICKVSVLDARKSLITSKEWSTNLDSDRIFEFPQFINYKCLEDKTINNGLYLVFDFTYKTNDVYSAVESISSLRPRTEELTQSVSLSNSQHPFFQPLSSASNLLNQQMKTTVADASTGTDNESDLITETLKNNLHDMYLYNSWSDVVLLAEGQSFPCHKCIISARSPVLQSLLLESTGNTLDLKLKASVLGSMLQFIYIGDIGTPMDCESALELYKAATEYEIISLRNVCSKFLGDNMTEQNVCEILILSCKLEDNTLKMKAESFIRKGAANILGSERWKDLVKNDAEYVVETMHRLYLRKENITGIWFSPQMAAAISAVETFTDEPKLSFLSVYLSSLFSDFKLTAKNGKTFAVHRNILWARSPVLKAMLSSNEEGSSVDTLDIDMDEQTMENFLIFLYSGKVEETKPEELSKLYIQGDKYQILSLKDHCSELMIQALSLKNVFDILKMSDQCGNEKLKTGIFDFLTKDSIIYVAISSPEWKKLTQSNPLLVIETLDQVNSRLTNSNTTYSEVRTSSGNIATSIMQVNLLTLYEEKLFSDCKVCTNDRTFAVHKNILGARSPVLNAMFSCSLEEATTNTLNIPDIDGHTVDQMLRYIYIGTFEKSENLDLYCLYYAADKYQIISLKDWCSHLLRRKLSTENVCEILLLANRHGDTSLERCVHIFLNKNSEKVFNSDCWKDFMSDEPRLACETMLAIY